MKPNNLMMMFLLIIVVGASALALVVSFWTLSAHRRLLSSHQSGREGSVADDESFVIDPSLRLPGSMAARRYRIEASLRQLEVPRA